MARAYDIIKAEALSLADGQSMNIPCPWCGRDSFYVTRDGGTLKYIDFSVNCGKAGYIDSRGGHYYQEKEEVKQVVLFTGKLCKLMSDERDWLSNKFNLPVEMLRQVRYGHKDDRIYYPQYEADGRIAGYIARAYPELWDLRFKGPKALWKPTITPTGRLLFPHLDVLRAVREQSRVAVLEDWPSAMRVFSQTGLPAVALGGTQLYPGHVDTLLQLDVQEVVLLLDADAVVKAVKLKRENALAFPDMRIVALTGADPKDMTPQELQEVLEPVL